MRHGYDKCKDDWKSVLVRHLGQEYTLLEAKGLLEIRLSLFVRNELVDKVSHVKHFKQATGVAGVMGNKGGVTIGLTYQHTHLSFTSAHLAAHQSYSQARNDHVRSIMTSSIAKRHASHMVDPDLYHYAHHTFFMGDLNYRINYGEQAKSMAKKPTSTDFEAMVKLIESGDEGCKELFQHDQLMSEKAAGNVFRDFQEGKPYVFQPTFKVERNTKEIKCEHPLFPTT